MEFKIDEPKLLKIIIGEKTYEIKKPRMAHQKQLESDIKEAEQGKTSTFQPMINYLVGLGLPEDVVLDLEQDIFSDLISHLTGLKKKESLS